jgi:hypothetical protein
MSAAVHHSTIQKYKIHIASVCLAIVIWLLVISNGTFDYVVTVPIRPPANPTHLILAQSLPESATVRVRGQGVALLAFLLFRETQLEPKIEWVAGPQTIRFSKEDIVLSGSARTITVLQLIDPLEQTVLIEKIEKKRVAIIPRITVKPIAGYTAVGEITLTPDSVNVEGPLSFVHPLRAVATRELLLEAVKRPIRGEIDLALLPETKISLAPRRISYRQDVQKLMEKRINNIPIQVVNTPPEMSAFAIPASLSLIAEGGVQTLAGLNEKQIKAYIDFPRRTEDASGDYPAYVEPLPGIRYRAIEPKRFKVIMERKR